LQSFNWEVLDRSTHSPDLAPTNVHLSLHSKKRLASQKFHEDKEVENEFAMWLHVQMVECCDIRVQKLIARLNEYLDKGGGCVEK
jgi:hypothetical protein